MGLLYACKLLDVDDSLTCVTTVSETSKHIPIPQLPYQFETVKDDFGDQFNKW